MTQARVYRSGTDRRGHRFFFIDGKKVSKERFHDSATKSLNIQRQVRDRLGHVGRVPPSLRRVPRPTIVRAGKPRPKPRRFLARVRARPRSGRVGDEYTLIEIDTEALDVSDILAAAEAAFPDLVPFAITARREAPSVRGPRPSDVFSEDEDEEGEEAE